MGTFLVVIILIVSLLIAAVVLVQNPKGGGLATGFQGASQFGGVQKTTDFLEKSTWYLTIALFVLCLISAKFMSGTNGTDTAGFQEEEMITTDPIFNEETIELNDAAAGQDGQ